MRNTTEWYPGGQDAFFEDKRKIKQLKKWGFDNHPKIKEFTETFGMPPFCPYCDEPVIKRQSESVGRFIYNCGTSYHATRIKVQTEICKRIQELLKQLGQMPNET